MKLVTKILFLIVVLTSFVNSVVAQSTQNEIILETPQGKLLGTTASVDNTIKIFKGIPYALPPTGNRRWKPAENFPAWSGVRKADTYAPDCMSQSVYREPTKNPEANFFYHLPHTAQ